LSISTGLSDAEFGPLALSPKKTAVALDISLRRVYDLLNAGEFDSYLNGASRKITVESICRYQARQLVAGKDGAALVKHGKIAAATTMRLTKVRTRRMQRAQQMAKAPARGAGSPP